MKDDLVHMEYYTPVFTTTGKFYSYDKETLCGIQSNLTTQNIFECSCPHCIDIYYDLICNRYSK